MASLVDGGVVLLFHTGSAIRIYVLMDLVNKHGSPEDMNRMMARLEAELARPDPDDGAIIDFPRGEAPLVQVGKLRGTAVAYTRHYGLVEFAAQAGSRFQWFLGSQIKRIQKEGA